MAQEIPHFHDGYLTGIILNEQGATVYLCQVTGEEYALTLSGLEALQMEDFRQGNIISMVEVIRGNVPSGHSCLERLFQPPHPSADQKYHDAHDAVIAKQSARIASGEVSLLKISPSYGGDLLAICRDVKLTSVP
jgi:hypothetical protein